MAGMSGSDRLMFPIGFDLDGAVKDAGNEWNNTYYDKLNKIVQKKPLMAKISFDTKQLDNLDDVRKRLQALKLQPVTPETKSAIQSLVKELKSLENILERIDRLNKSSAAASSGPAAVRAARIAEIESRAAGRAAIDREKARQAAARAAQAEAKLEQAVLRTGNAYKSTGGYIERLLKRTLVLFGVHQVTRFAQKLREVTAEFELQRVSLGAIIQDQERANALFSQIKTFAVQSPFEIKDLVGYVKQLSAYRIETDKLFDTTKRIADVSAGLGTDMGRLILAYGQVRAASVLRGQEVRQFTETGIPLIELLAEKFTALRGEVVSTSEVFDLISQRAVSFKMVEEIFNDMTNAGGMFYNMQEKQAQTLAGQWSNLKDSLSIMYDEMGNVSSVRSAMESVIETTKTLAKNWELVGGIMAQVLGGAVILGVVNKFKSLWSALGNQMYAATSKVANAQARYNTALDRFTSLSATATRLERAEAFAKYRTATSALKAAKALEAQAASANRLTFALKRIGAVLKANWFGILISAALTAAQVISHLVKKSNELRNSLAEVEKEGEKSARAMVTNFEALANKAVKAADGSKEQRDAIAELKRTYKDMIPTQKLTIDNLREMAGNYDILTQAIKENIRQQTYLNELNKIAESTAEKVSDREKKLRKILKSEYTFTDTAVDRFFAGIEQYAKDTALSIEEVIRSAFDFAGITNTRTIEMFLELQEKNVEKIVNAYREEDRMIDTVNRRMKEATGLVGKYGDSIDAAKKNVEEWVDANKDSLGTFALDEGRAKKAAQEYIDVLKQVFADSGLTFKDVWVNGKYIDFGAIEKELRAAGNQVPAQAINAFGKIQSEYEQIVPSDKFSKVLNDTLFGIADSFGASMDLVVGYMKDGDTGIQDYAKSIADSIEELQGNVKALQALLAKPSPLNPTEIENAESSLAKYQMQLDILTEYYEKVKKYTIEKEKGGRSSSDKRLSNLKEEISMLEKLYSNYKKYTEYESKSDAQERINREFGKTLEIFKKYGIELPKTSEEYQAALRKLQDVMRGLPDSQKDVLELGFKIENVDFEDTKDKLEKQIKRLADEVSRTKTAKEFFDKMLNMTGDQQLSATVTMSVYGDTGAGLQDKLIAQIRDAFKGIDDEQINLAIGVDSVDYKKLREIWEADKLLGNDRKIQSKYDSIIQEILDNQEKANREWLLDTFKVYEEFRTFEEQRTAVVRRETEKRKKIEESADLSDEQKAKLKAASIKKEAEELNDIDWAEFKASDDWIKTFENMDRVATPTIERLIKKLREFIDANKDLTTEQLKTVMGEYNKLYEELIHRNPFKAIVDGITDYKASLGELAGARSTLAAAQGNLETAQQGVEMAKATGNADMLAQALRRLAEAEKMVSDAESDVSDAQDDLKESFSKLQKGMQGVSSLASNLQSIFSQVFDLFGIAEDSELGEYLQDVAKALGIVSAALGVVASMLAIVDALTAPVAAAVAAVAALGAGLMFLANTKVRKANREIERQQEIIDALSYSYGRLQKAAENLFSSEFVSNFRKQQENLRAQIEAVEKQLAAEQSKGNKADDDKIKDYQESIRSLKDELSEMYGTLSAQMLGTDLTSAARTFAQSWLDAYKEFGDTRKAIEGEMRSMMENLIVEAALGSVMQQALKDVFDMIENMNEGDFYNDKFWSDIVSEMAKATDNATAGADAMMKKLEAAGVNIRDLGSEFTGISKEVASASSEEILAATSVLNTSLYYVSNIDRNVAQIVAIMQGGGYELTSGEQMSDLVTLQNQHLAHLPQIAANTAATAERCERAAQACEAIAANLDRVIKPNGVAGNYRVNTSLSS